MFSLNYGGPESSTHCNLRNTTNTDSGNIFINLTTHELQILTTQPVCPSRFITSVVLSMKMFPEFVFVVFSSGHRRLVLKSSDVVLYV